MKRWLFGIVAVAMLLAGATQSRAAFILNFDENGTGSLSVNGGPFVAVAGVFAADAREGGSSLTYILPETVVSGDVGIRELGASSNDPFSDMMRFTNANGVIDGGLNADRMIFYSDFEPNGASDGDVADRHFTPTGTFGINENPNGSFSYFASPNTYNGLSDGDAPEPATITLLGIGLVGMAGYGYRRRKVAQA